MKRFVFYLAIVAGVAVLTFTGGCATVSDGDIDAKTGAASNNYERTVTHPDGTVEQVKVSNVTARDLTDAELSIGADGSLHVKAANTEGGAYGAQLLEKALDKLPNAGAPLGSQ